MLCKIVHEEENYERIDCQLPPSYQEVNINTYTNKDEDEEEDIIKELNTKKRRMKLDHSSRNSALYKTVRIYMGKLTKEIL